MKADPILLACFFVFILFLFCNSRKKSFRSRFKKKIIILNLLYLRAPGSFGKLSNTPKKDSEM